MARGNTCGGCDSTAPDEILECVKKWAEKNRPTWKHIDNDEICLLEILNGKRCPEDANDREKDLCALSKLPSTSAAAGGFYGKKPPGDGTRHTPKKPVK